MARDSLSFGGKLAVIAAYFALWWAGYTYTNERGASSPRAIYFTPPTSVVPELLQPWTAVIYVAGGALLPVLVFYHYWTWPKIAFVLVAYATASAIAFACYLLWPVCIARPTYEGSGAGLWLMREVIAVDDASNCTPSSHTFYAVLPALLIQWKARRRATRVAVWLLAVAVCVTTITTGQHYLFDVLAGAITAVIAAYAAWRMFPEGTVPNPR